MSSVDATVGFCFMSGLGQIWAPLNLITACPMLKIAKLPNSEEMCLHHLHIVMGWIRLVWPHVMKVGMSKGCSTSATQIATDFFKAIGSSYHPFAGSCCYLCSQDTRTKGELGLVSQRVTCWGGLSADSPPWWSSRFYSRNDGRNAKNWSKWSPIAPNTIITIQTCISGVQVTRILGFQHITAHLTPKWVRLTWGHAGVIFPGSKKGHIEIQWSGTNIWYSYHHLQYIIQFTSLYNFIYIILHQYTLIYPKDSTLQIRACRSSLLPPRPPGFQRRQKISSSLTKLGKQTWLNHVKPKVPTHTITIPVTIL